MQVKLLKVGTDGVPLEFDSASDEITLQLSPPEQVQ